MTRLQKVLMGAVSVVALTAQMMALILVMRAIGFDGWISYQRLFAVIPVGLLIFNSPILVLMLIVRHEDKKDAARKRAVSKNKRKPK